MNNFVRILLCVVIIAYVLSPIDCIPGPVDDILVILLGYLANRKVGIEQK